MSEDKKWFEHAYLFTSGAFKVRYGCNMYALLGTDREGWNCRIIAPREIDPFAGLNEEMFKGISICTLIARPISDMTVEECKGLTQWAVDDCDHKMVHMSDKERAKLVKKYLSDSFMHELDGDELIHLLSIGVLPPEFSTEQVEFLTREEQDDRRRTEKMGQ